MPTKHLFCRFVESQRDKHWAASYNDPTGGASESIIFGCIAICVTWDNDGEYLRMQHGSFWTDIDDLQSIARHDPRFYESMMLDESLKEDHAELLSISKEIVAAHRVYVGNKALIEDVTFADYLNGVFGNA